MCKLCFTHTWCGSAITTVWFQIFMRQYFHETIFSWISVITCVLRKYWTQFSICSLSQDSLLYTGWRAPCHHQMKTTLYCSIQFYSCSKPESVKITSYPPVWLTEHPTQSALSPTQKGTYAILTPKQRATIENYAILHGTSTALWHFKK